MVYQRLENKIFMLLLVLGALVCAGNLQAAGDDLDDLPALLGPARYGGYADLLERANRIKPETPLRQVAQLGVKEGFKQALSSTTREVASNSLRFIPNAITKIGGFMASFLYKLAFNSKGLTAADLANMSGRIHSLCVPFTTLSAGNLDKKRRAALIAQEQQPTALQDDNWVVVQSELIKELKHAILYLKKVLPCYNLTYMQNSTFKRQLAGFLHSFSTEDRDQISFYILRTINYLDKLIELIDGFHSFEEAQQKYEETKRWLAWICGSFEQISLFLDDNNTGSTTNTKYGSNRVTFPKINTQSSGGMPPLEPAF